MYMWDIITNWKISPTTTVSFLYMCRIPEWYTAGYINMGIIQTDVENVTSKWVSCSAEWHHDLPSLQYQWKEMPTPQLPNWAPFVSSWHLTRTSWKVLRSDKVAFPLFSPCIIFFHRSCKHNSSYFYYYLATSVT